MACLPLASLDSNTGVRCPLIRASQFSAPPEPPPPLPFACACISIGLPAFSAPVVKSRAWSHWWNVVGPLDLEMAYRVFVAGSMTGVPVTPMSGIRSPQLTSLPVTHVSFAPKRLFGAPHKFAQEELSASNAYMLSCCVATYTTL